MNKTILLSSLAALALSSGTANAVSINFDAMPAAVYGDTNSATGCTPLEPCYTESGLMMGTVADAAGPSAHVHQYADFLSTDFAVQYHQDSAGIYLRKADESAFSLDTLDIRHLQGAKNAGSGFTAHHAFQIEAFSEALNTDIVGATQGTGANFLGMQTITDASVGTLTLGSIFSDVKAVWIHFDQSTSTPTGNDVFDLRVDNAVISDVLVSSVPVPAAAYLFATGLLGLVSFGKRKTA